MESQEVSMEISIENGGKVLHIHKNGQRGCGSTENIINIIKNKFIQMKSGEFKILLAIPRRLYHYDTDIINKILYAIVNQYDQDSEEYKTIDLLRRSSPAKIVDPVNDKTLFIHTITYNDINNYHSRGLRLDSIFVLDIPPRTDEKLSNVLREILPCVYSSTHDPKIFLEYE